MQVLHILTGGGFQVNEFLYAIGSSVPNLLADASGVLMTDPHRVAELLARVTVWQAQQPQLKPMRPHELVKLFDEPLSQITPVLEILGWTRTVYRGWAHGRRYRRVFWLPKGISLFSRPRGRPSLQSLLYPILTV